MNELREEKSMERMEKYYSSGTNSRLIVNSSTVSVKRSHPDH